MTTRTSARRSARSSVRPQRCSSPLRSRPPPMRNVTRPPPRTTRTRRSWRRTTARAARASARRTTSRTAPRAETQPPRGPPRLRPRLRRRAHGRGAGGRRRRVGAEDRVAQQRLRAVGEGAEVRLEAERHRAARADRLVDDRRGPAERLRPVRVARDEEVRRARGRVAQRHDAVRRPHHVARVPERRQGRPGAREQRARAGAHRADQRARRGDARGARVGELRRGDPDRRGEHGAVEPADVAAAALHPAPDRGLAGRPEVLERVRIALDRQVARGVAVRHEQDVVAGEARRPRSPRRSPPRTRGPSGRAASAASPTTRCRA